MAVSERQRNENNRPPLAEGRWLEHSFLQALQESTQNQTASTTPRTDSRGRLANASANTFSFLPLRKDHVKPRRVLQSPAPAPGPRVLTARSAGEAAVVVEVAHGLASLVCSVHPLAALHAGAWKGKEETKVSSVPRGVGGLAAQDPAVR